MAKHCKQHVNHVPSHIVIDNYIRKQGHDYRYQDSPIRKRTAGPQKDNTEVGRFRSKN